MNENQAVEIQRMPEKMSGFCCFWELPAPISSMG